MGALRRSVAADGGGDLCRGDTAVLMAEQIERVVAELALPPHLFLYVARNLDPRTSSRCPYSLDLSMRMALALRMRAQISASALHDPSRLRGKLPLDVSLGEHPAVDPLTRDELQDMVEQFLFYETSRMAHKKRHTNAGHAVTQLMRTYGITPDLMSPTMLLAAYKRWLRKDKSHRMRRPYKDSFWSLPPLSARTAGGAAAGHLFADAGLQRYLVRCLNPATAHTTPYGNRLGERIAQHMELAVTMAAHDEKRPWVVRLAIAVRPGEQQRQAAHNRMVRTAEEMFTHEFVTTVDKMMSLGLPRAKAIDFSRERYGITEDEIPLHTSERFYRRYRRALRGQNGSRGRQPGSRTQRR